MIQNYIVGLIGIAVAVYIGYKIIRAFFPAGKKAESKCGPGCCNCPSYTDKRLKPLTCTDDGKRHTTQ